MNKTIKREIEVAFSKHSQAIWIRVLKYMVLTVLIFFFWKQAVFWFALFVVFVLSLTVHLFYRYKTAAWTKSYGGWKHESDLERKNEL